MSNNRKTLMKAGHASTLGEHNGYVCRDLLGVPRERVEALQAQKVLQ